MSMKSAWFPLGTYPDAEFRLLCLPHAGAGASTYNAWGKGLPSAIKACPVQPPGRERRRRETPFTTVDPLAQDLAREIAAFVSEPFALFGHSMGALCAFETARELRRIGGPQPVHLFASGRRAPQIPMDWHDLSTMDATELAAFLREMNGTPEELLVDLDLMGFLQPLLAADFSVNERYIYIHEDPLGIPMTAFAGLEDAGAGVADMAPWEFQTSREFRFHALDGGHFAIFDHAAEVNRAIATAMLCGER